MPLDWDYFRHISTGSVTVVYGPTNGPIGGHTSTSSGVGYCTPFLAARGGTITTARIFPTVQASGDFVRGAIYARASDANILPAALLADVGCFSVSSLLVMVNSLAIPVSSGALYWFVTMMGNLAGSGIHGTAWCWPVLGAEPVFMSTAAGVFTVTSIGPLWPSPIPLASFIQTANQVPTFWIEIGS